MVTHDELQECRQVLTSRTLVPRTYSTADAPTSPADSSEQDTELYNEVKKQVGTFLEKDGRVRFMLQKMEEVRPA